MAAPSPPRPISRADLSRSLGAALHGERQAEVPAHLASLPPLRALVVQEQGWLLSEEHYLRRQAFDHRFARHQAWLLLVLQGRLVLDRHGREQPLFLQPGATNLCLTQAAQQEFTVLEAPLRLLRIGLPVQLAWSQPERSAALPMPLLEPMLQLIQQAQRDPEADATRQRLLEALQGYCSSQLEGLGVQLVPSGLDPLQTLLDWLRPRLDQPLTLADLAGAACLSPRRLQELCHERFDQTPMELVRDLRLEALHGQLQDPGLGRESLAALYKRLHLADSAATRKAFEARYGRSPADLRRRVRA
mgnify:CR=1 FL=1